jgi:GNAT superfamily N-acetyltransferase
VTYRISPVTSESVAGLIPLLREYCDFYGVAPTDDRLTQLCEALLADPREGIQLLATDEAGNPSGFATVYWSWSTLSAARIGVMNDLYVKPSERGSGLAEALIAECAKVARGRSASHLTWQTAVDNHRAQKVYDRVGGVREQWLDYSIALGD